MTSVDSGSRGTTATTTLYVRLGSQVLSHSGAPRPATTTTTTETGEGTPGIRRSDRGPGRSGGQETDVRSSNDMVKAEDGA